MCRSVRPFFRAGGEARRPRDRLATLVRRGRDGALDQYLLLLAWASKAPHDVRRDSRVWARAGGLADDASGRTAVSRNWRILRELKLVRTERSGRLVRVFLLREDGSGHAYTHPGYGAKFRYLQVPFAYWREDLHEKLTLPGKAVLLIALSLQDGFRSPLARPGLVRAVPVDGRAVGSASCDAQTFSLRGGSQRRRRWRPRGTRWSTSTRSGRPFRAEEPAGPVGMKASRKQPKAGAKVKGKRRPIPGASVDEAEAPYPGDPHCGRSRRSCGG